METSQIKEHLSVALVQYQIEWKNSEANRKKIGEMLSKNLPETDIIILPETFNTGFCSNPEGLAESPEGETIHWMRIIASEKNSAICGSMFVKESSKFYNRFLWVEPDGSMQTYDKRHLYSIGGEDEFLSKGTKQSCIEYKGWKIRTQICYDVRFPVWSRNTDNYDILINVSNWPAIKGEIRRTLLKARAIENQCYVAGVNCTGTDGNNIHYKGESLVADATGTEITNAGDCEKIEIAILDYMQLQSFREKFNTLKDRDNFEILS